jgi:hypothetical protein
MLRRLMSDGEDEMDVEVGIIIGKMLMLRP